LSKQLRLDVAQLTDVGRKRPHNEDNMAYVIPKDAQLMTRKGALFLVADGMGGHAAGEVASEIAVDTVSKVYYQDDGDDIAVSLLHAIKRANALIHQRAAENMLRSGMGTTCVAAVLRANVAYIANVGDSRAYLIRGGQVRQVSQDHSWVEEQVRAGLLTRDQARSHAQRNVITRCLGTQADVEVDVFTEELEEGDAFILCSDGLSGMVADEELRSIVDQYVPQESVYHLVERANEHGGSDNITAIVIRVQEVGWEPPAARRPVHVGGGGRELEEDTAIIGRVQAPMFSMPARVDDMRIPHTPLQMPSGPLHLSVNNSPVSAALAPSRPATRRIRLLSALLALLLIGVAGVGGYVFLHSQNQQAHINQALADASTQIDQAKGDASTNPADALTRLAKAQQELGTLQALSDTQHAKLVSLQADLTATTKTAITSYNQQALITPFSCSVVSAPLNNGNVAVATPTSTSNEGTVSINTIASLQDEKGKTVSYLLSDDHAIYQMDAHQTLTNKLGLAGNPQVLMMTSSAQRLVALSTQPPKGTTPASYTISLLKAQQSGALQDLNDMPMDATFSKDGLVPTVLTTSGTDVYVVLVSTADQNTATILDFPINGDKLGSTQQAKISITTSIISLTSFTKNQLFLLYRDGSVQSLQWNNGKPTPPVSVFLQHPLPAPLAIAAADFSATSPVPVPATGSSSPSSVLAIPGATFLTSGMVNNVAHLFLVDGSSHRVIDLRVAPAPVPATPVANATPAATATTPATATSGTGTPVTMELVQQYASSNLLSSVRGITPDPNTPVLYLLTQGGQTPSGLNLISLNINLSQRQQCPQ